MYKKILVPLDGSEVAEGVLPYVSQIARGTGATLLLHMVIDPDSIVGPHSTTKSDDMLVSSNSADMPQLVDPSTLTVTEPKYKVQLEADAIEQVEGSLKAIVRKLKAQGVEAEANATIGKPAKEIVRLAAEKRCDLIAMATHGRNAIGRGVLGSVTDRVIHTTDIPTLTITPEKAEKYGYWETRLTNIMVPLDGSELAETALPVAEALATALSFKIKLVRAVETGEYFLSSVYGHRPYSTAKFNEELVRGAEEYLDGVAARLGTKGVKVEKKVMIGPPAHVIVDLAQETPRALIVMTTHGRSGFIRWILGSVPETVVRASGDLVLVIPPKDGRG